MQRRSGTEAEYQDQIKIYVGFEAEYVPEFYEEQMRLFRNLGCDYMIMGQHFLGSEQMGPYTGTETEDESRIRRYVDLVIEGMQTGSYAYLAHPDLMNYQGMDSVYDREMTRLCKEMKEPTFRWRSTCSAWEKGQGIIRQSVSGRLPGKSEIKRFSDWMPTV